MCQAEIIVSVPPACLFSKKNGTQQGQAVQCQGLPYSIFKAPTKSKAGLFSLTKDELLNVKDKLNIILQLISNRNILHMFGFSSALHLQDKLPNKESLNLPMIPL